jgi:hypothetical protein
MLRLQTVRALSALCLAQLLPHDCCCGKLKRTPNPHEKPNYTKTAWAALRGRIDCRLVVWLDKIRAYHCMHMQAMARHMGKRDSRAEMANQNTLGRFERGYARNLKPFLGTLTGVHRGGDTQQPVEQRSDHQEHDVGMHWAMT